MLERVLADVVEESVAAVLELSVDVLGEVRLVVPIGEVPSRRAGLGADEHHNVALARRDRVAEFRDELLRALPADGFQHRAGRVRADRRITDRG